MPQAQNLIIKICAIILAWFGKNIETTDTQEEMYSLGVYVFYCTVWKNIQTFQSMQSILHSLISYTLYAYTTAWFF